VPAICSGVRSSRLAETIAEGHTRPLLGFALKWIQSISTAGYSYNTVPEGISHCLPAIIYLLSQKEFLAAAI